MLALWPRVRPWLGFALVLYEVAQPLFGRPVEIGVLGIAGTMMAAEIAGQALRRNGGEKVEEP